MSPRNVPSTHTDTVYSVTDRVDLHRRGLIRLAMAAPLASAAAVACTGDDDAGKWTPSAPTDRDSHVRWRSVRAEQRLIAMHNATLERHPDLADVVNQIIQHHEDHLAAILADGPLPVGAQPVDEGGQHVPKARDAAMGALNEAEENASASHASACLAAGGPVLAALLGSIAASEASHAAVMDTL